MERKVKFTPPVLEQLLKLGPLEPVRLTPLGKRNNLGDIVVDREQLLIIRAVNHLKSEFRQLELEEIIRKNKKDVND
jgi:hypothetical protein